MPRSILPDVSWRAANDALIGQHFAAINARFGDSRYATSIVGVSHLPAQFLVMLEATAVD